MDALTLISRERIDFRDLSVDFPLYAVRQLGGDPVEAARTAARNSEPGTRGDFEARAHPAATVTLADCALVEVHSVHGLGFLEAWGTTYNAAGDLPGVAVRVADRIDDEGRYEVDGLRICDLPGVWFDGDPRRGVHLPTRGCALVSAPLRGGARYGNGLLVFIAELDQTATASSLAGRAITASTVDRPRGASAEGRQLLLAIGGSSSLGELPIETTGSMQVWADRLHRQLS